MKGGQPSIRIARLRRAERFCEAAAQPNHFRSLVLQKDILQEACQKRQSAPRWQAVETVFRQSDLIPP